jgi:hypothetical protein
MEIRGSRHCFNARGPDGLLDGNVPGKRSRLDDARFVSKPPNPPEKPTVVGINPPTRTAYIRA